MAKVISKAGELDITPLEALPEIFKKARDAQSRWGALPVKNRARILIQIREAILNQADPLIDLIVKENGKPRFEAISNELLPAVELVTFYAKVSNRALKDRSISMGLMKHRKSYLNYWPLGVVVIISPWNYPFSIPFGEIIMALVAGNAVIFKPSEYTPFVGLKIQEVCENAGLPLEVLQTVIGDGKLGAALIQQKPNKIFFTGSVATGRRIAVAAAEHLLPVNLELGGKDPMIILPDVDLDFASSAALWGSFSNSGQACASTERLLVHESIAEPFLAKFKEKAAMLGENELGTITMEKQKETYTQQIDEARAKGALFLTGGEFSPDRRKLRPTIVTGSQIESLGIYREETFGAAVAVTTFKSVAEAVQKANDSRYGLCASIITRNLSLGEEVAKQLETGTVMINEVTYTHGLAETPWGGLKESGTGRTHSEQGLYEFVNVRHIHRARARFLVFKSLWWFPYTSFQFSMFRELLNVYRKSWLDRLRALPMFLWNMVQFLKNERRL